MNLSNIIPLHQGIRDAIYAHQQALLLVDTVQSHWAQSNLSKPHGNGIWDPVQGRLAPGVLPYIGAIPLFVVGVIVVCSMLRWAIPNPPVWMTNFVSEVRNELTETEAPPTRGAYTSWTLMLSVTSILGCISETIRWSHCSQELHTLFISISWALSACLVAWIRPASTSWALVALYTAIFLAQAIYLASDSPEMRWIGAFSWLSLFSSIAATAIALNMPMRAPFLSRDGICPVGHQPTTTLRTPEDNLTLWQWMTVTWMTSLLSVEKTNHITGNDVWSLGYEFQQKRLYDQFRLLRGSVFSRLLNANGLDIIVLCMLGIVELSAFLVQPILLQQLLSSLENPDSTRRAAMVISVLIFTASFLDTQCCCIGLWIGRRVYERSRGIMMTMIYEKTLKRKVPAISSAEYDKFPAEEPQSAAADLLMPPQNSFIQMYQKSKQIALQVVTKPFNLLPKQQATPNSPAPMGKILDIIKSDVYDIAQQLWEVDKYIKRVGHIIFSIILIWKLLGLACLLGALTIIIAQFIIAAIARLLLRWEKLRRTATDGRVQAVSEFTEAIRHLRWYGWQDVWKDGVIDKRKRELRLRIVTSSWNMLIMLIDGMASGMFPFVAFYAYTVYLGKPLRVDLAFPALTLFRNLEYNLKQVPALIRKFINTLVALQRVEDLMSEPDLPEPEEITVPDWQPTLREASFSWPRRCTPVLSGVTITFKPGLSVVFGTVAAGKTALILGLLGELEQPAGEYVRSTGPVGYCAQTPWLQSMSIRENILFNAPYDENRYCQVLNACSLMPDLRQFKNGDQSLLGENGVGLSGGQRARVALARAIYGTARVLMLDDPLSALDSTTAKQIVQNCFKGSLVQGRTIILVTHRLDICQDFADQLIEVKDGSTRVIKENGGLQPNVIMQTPQIPGDEAIAPEEVKRDRGSDSFIEEEHQRHGGIEVSVYWEYIKAGKVHWWLCLALFLALSRCIYIGQSWFLKEWGEAYGQVEQRSTPLASFFDSLPNPETNVRPWLAAFFFITVAQTVTGLMAEGFMLVIVYFAGKNMFRDVLRRVAHAPFRFYDITPTGRLMNRMISDMGAIDGNVSRQLQSLAELSTIWITSIAVIASVAPIFVVYSLLMTGAFIYFFLQFLPASHSLRRLSMVSLSPLMSGFSDVIQGLATIRAFGVQTQFQNRIMDIIDAFQRMDHFYWSLQAWLNYRFDALADVSIFIFIVLAVYTNTSPGLVAFALVSAQQFVEVTHSLCQCYGQLQMDFVSVERVVELLKLDQEPLGNVMPPAYWPASTGDLQFSNVTIRYAPNLDPVVKDLSLTIRGGSTVTIVGRTGSGKSTIALSLLGAIPLDAGSIFIDGIDLARVNKQALRSRVTFVAQDPMLFCGSLRANLDPLGEHSDMSCMRVISLIAPSHSWTLQTHIDAGGRNLSQGQRQLIGLARAILSRATIVILDEATASIDLDTSRKVLQILREELQGATVVVIAHRLEAIGRAERCVVIEQGRLVEQRGGGN